MKEKWVKLAAFLGLAAFVSSADGVFMKEEDIDKMEAVRVKNEELEASIATLKKEKEDSDSLSVTQLSAKDDEIVRVSTERDSIKKELETASATVAKLSGTSTEAKGKKADPDMSASKKKLTAREREFEAIAAEFRGETYSEVAEEDEYETESK